MQFRRRRSPKTSNKSVDTFKNEGIAYQTGFSFKEIKRKNPGHETQFIIKNGVENSINSILSKKSRSRTKIWQLSTEASRFNSGRVKRKKNQTAIGKLSLRNVSSIDLRPRKKKVMLRNKSTYLEKKQKVAKKKNILIKKKISELKKNFLGEDLESNNVNPYSQTQPSSTKNSKSENKKIQYEISSKTYVKKLLKEAFRRCYGRRNSRHKKSRKSKKAIRTQQSSNSSKHFSNL